MIVVDTTVLVYAVGTDHPLREPCQRLIRAIADGTILATTTIEVVQEFTHVRARRRDRKDAAGKERLSAPLTRSWPRRLVRQVPRRSCRQTPDSPASQPSAISSLTPMLSTGCSAPRENSRAA